MQRNFSTGFIYIKKIIERLSININKYSRDRGESESKVNFYFKIFLCFYTPEPRFRVTRDNALGILGHHCAISGRICFWQ